MKLILGILFFIGAGAAFFLYTQPAYSAVGQTQAQIAEYQQALNNASQLDSLRQTLLAKYNAFNPSDLARLQTMLPDQVDNIGLILDIDNIASRYGLALENVDVSSADSGATAASAPTVVGSGDTQTYGSLTLQFSTYGTYQSFESFLIDLEDSLRIVDLVSLNITQQGASSGGGASAGSYRYDMTIQTYWLK